MIKPSEEIVREFIQRINSADLEGLLELMTPDHVFFVEGEAPTSGKDRMRQAWIGYFTSFPTYQIYIDELYARGEQVIVVGHTSGSHIGPELESIPGCVIWEARVSGGLVSSWIIYPTNPENRKRFNLT